MSFIFRFTVSGQEMDAQNLRTPPRRFHWVQGTDMYKLTTPVDLYKRWTRRYYVAPLENWSGGRVPAFMTLRGARRFARQVARWNHTGVKICKWNAYGKPLETYKVGLDGTYPNPKKASKK